VNNTKASASVILRHLLSCSTIRNKAVLMALLSLISFVFSIAIGYLCYLFVGPTSLGIWYNSYWICFFFLCGFLASSFFVFRHDIKTKPENLFLAIVLSITCFSSLSFNVNAPSWDSGSHYRFVVEWSRLGSPVALSVTDIKMMELSSVDLYFNLSDLDNYADTLNAESAFLDGSFARTNIVFGYKSIASHPATLVYVLLSLLPISFSSKYILTRLIYAIIYSLVTFTGMKQLRSGKMLYAVIALLPTAVFLASNYGYDYWVNAFILCSTALLVRELQTPQEPISLKRVFLIIGLFVAAMGPKAIYFPLVLLCLLVPRSKFSSPQASRLFRGAVLFACLFVVASFLIPFLHQGLSSGDPRGGEAVSPTEQVKFILSNPFEYARILSSFLQTYCSLNTSASYINFYAYLGFSAWQYWVLVLFMMLFTAITDKSEVDKALCTWKSRVLSLTLSVVTIALVATSLYVAFTPVGSETIAGCQPRYIIPVLFCTLIFLSSHRLAWPRENNRKKTMYNTAILGLMSFVLMAGLWQVYIGLLW